MSEIKHTRTKKKPGQLENFFKMLSYYKEFKWRVILIILLGSASVVLLAFVPSFLKDAFDVLRAWMNTANPISDAMASVVKYLVLFGVFAIVNALFDMLCSYLIFNYENKIRREKQVEFKRKLDVIPTTFLEKFAVGDLTRRMANLTDEVVRHVLNAVYTIARISVFFISVAVIMFTINWILAIIVVMSLPLCIFTARFVARRTQKYFNNFAKVSADAYSFVDQKFSLQSFYNLHGIEADDAKFEKLEKAHTRGWIGEDTATAFNTVYITYIRQFMMLLVTLVFGIMYVTQVIPTEFGVLPAFIIFSNRFLDNTVIVTTVTNLLQGISAKSPRVLEILECPENVTEKEHLDITEIKSGITFKNVSLQNREEVLLDNVSFKIPQGAAVAFVGPTGCGKSRIVELMAKLVIPSEGQITVDGINLEEINSRSYYKCLGLSLERPFIFRGTVAENLLYGIRRALPENVMAITERLGSHNFIEALDNGYETQLSENASVLSDSQKQSIGVARLVLQGPDIAIFNGSMSSADTVTEKAVFEEIMGIDKMQTTVFVTHRLSTVEKCDVIYYMRHGRIVEKGTHAELMARKKEYYKAYTGGA